MSVPWALFTFLTRIAKLEKEEDLVMTSSKERNGEEVEKSSKMEWSERDKRKKKKKKKKRKRYAPQMVFPLKVPLQEE